MKYTPKLYARAFGDIASQHPKLNFQEEVQLLKNFLRVIEKHGDAGKLGKILDACERFLRAKEGLRKVTIETARLLPNAKKSLKGFLKPDDIVEEKIYPALIAGVKITLNDEEQFDATLARKLKKLFNI